MNKPISISSIDPAVIQAMVAMARLNKKAREEGNLDLFCCACRQQLRGNKGGKPGRDFQDYRVKSLKDSKNGEHVIGACCEKCNRELFEHSVWLGKT